MPPDVTTVILQQLTVMQQEMTAMRIDVQKVQLQLAEKRGERRALVTFASVLSGAVGAAVTFLVRYFLAGAHP